MQVPGSHAVYVDEQVWPTQLHIGHPFENQIHLEHSSTKCSLRLVNVYTGSREIGDPGFS